MDYITCHRKKSFPKVPVEICAQCKRKKTCRDYGRYIQPSLFPRLDQGPPEKPGRGKKRPKPQS